MPGAGGTGGLGGHASGGNDYAGGGSYDSGTGPVLVSGFQSGNGEVDITAITAAPERASAALLVAGLAGLGMARRRRSGSS